MFDLKLLLQHIENQPKRVEEQIIPPVRPMQPGVRRLRRQLQSDGRIGMSPDVNADNPFRFGDPQRKPERRPETPSPENNFDFPFSKPPIDPGFYLKIPEPKPDPRFPGMPPGFKPPRDPGFYPKMPEPKPDPRFPGMPDGFRPQPKPYPGPGMGGPRYHRTLPTLNPDTGEITPPKMIPIPPGARPAVPLRSR